MLSMISISWFSSDTYSPVNIDNDIASGNLLIRDNDYLIDYLMVWQVGEGQMGFSENLHFVWEFFFKNSPERVCHRADSKKLTRISGSKS
jgi:hypothetical protein